MNSEAPSSVLLEPIKSRPVKGHVYLLPRKTKGFSIRQLKFLNAYMSGENAYLSAKKAGYKESVAKQASQIIVKNPKISQEIHRRLQKAANAADLVPEEILSRLCAIARLNPLDYVDRLPNGEAKYNVNYLEREVGVAVETFEYDAFGRFRIKWRNRDKAEEVLAKVVGILQDKGKSTGGSLLPSIEELDEIVSKSNVTINQQINIHQHHENKQLAQTISSE